jgi:hypothetical protein
MTATGPEAGPVAPRPDADDAPAVLPDAPAVLPRVRERVGSGSDALVDELFMSTLRCLRFPNDATPEAQAQRAEAALEAFASVAPRDGIEGLLGAQSAALHLVGIDLLQRSQAPGMPPELAGRLRRDAISLLRCMHDTLGVIDRRRGNGTRQVVRIERVVVQDNAQAVVGAVAAGPGGGGGDG